MKKRTLLAMGMTLSFLIASCNQEIISLSTSENVSLTSPSTPSSTSITSDTSVSSSGLSTSVSPSANPSVSSSPSNSASTQTDSIYNYITTPKYEYYKQKGYEKLYEDINFAKGFILTKTSTTAPGGMYHDQYLKHYEEFENEEPEWILAQWGSKYDMYKALIEENSNDGFTFSYTSRGGKILEDGMKVPAKKVEFNSKTGSVYLECNAETEYDEPRKPGESWPSLLLGQNFDNRLIKVNDCNSIVMEAQYEVTKFEDKMGSSAINSTHAAQAVWYVTLSNRNRSSKEYGKYIWLGIRLWDNRDAGKETTLFSAIDGGTSSLMYNTQSTDYLKSNDGKLPNVNEKVVASIDIIETAHKAYEAAVSRGYFNVTQFNDLYLGGTNFGLEIPGTYNLGISIDDINVYYQ